MRTVYKKTLMFLTCMSLVLSYSGMSGAKVVFCKPGEHSCTTGGVFGVHGKKGQGNRMSVQKIPSNTF